MPNTLAHIGLQGLLTRAALRRADFKWICLGCVIPDIPWIIQRGVVQLAGADHINLYDLRLYAIVQSSLITCLLLSLAVALLSSSPRRVFSVLALNSFFHLVLDGLETKWANGVHLFAPFSWELWNLGLFWPESPWVTTATVGGAAYFFYAWRRDPGEPVGLRLSPRHIVAALGLLALYLALPPFFTTGPEEANNHYVKLLRNPDQRQGELIECDRCSFVQSGRIGILASFTGEKFVLQDSIGLKKGAISVRGRFVDENTVEVHQVHEHWAGIRDGASKLGLLLIALLWLDWLRRGSGWKKLRRS